MNYINLLPPFYPYRSQINDIIISLPYLCNPNDELCNIVVAILLKRYKNYQLPIQITRGLHIGAFGDLYHFNIRSPYLPNEIHVYVDFDPYGIPYYIGMS